jgi:tRNA(fMet)-specific endonuclease VapC
MLDTDIYSEILKSVDPTVTRNATSYRQAQGVCTLSTVTVMEIIRGFQKNQSQRKLQSFLSAVALEEVLVFDHSAAELAGRIAGELERVGRPIGLADPMIAPIALTHGRELTTGNLSHFQRVQQLARGCRFWNCCRASVGARWFARLSRRRGAGIGHGVPGTRSILKIMKRTKKSIEILHIIIIRLELI